MSFHAPTLPCQVLRLGRALALTRAGGPGAERESFITLDYWT